ncbi:unnamed protein product [Ectocarpus fasciculatus]
MTGFCGDIRVGNCYLPGKGSIRLLVWCCSLANARALPWRSVRMNAGVLHSPHSHVRIIACRDMFPPPCIISCPSAFALTREGRSCAATGDKVSPVCVAGHALVYA